MSTTEANKGVNQGIAELNQSFNLPTEVIETVNNSIVEAARQNVHGLSIGTKVPDFTLKNEEGHAVSLYQELKKGPVVLNFFRGEWCPYCNVELKELNQHVDDFATFNAQVLAVFPQEQHYGKAIKDKLATRYQLLSDPQQEVIRQYDLYFSIPDSVISLYKDAFGVDLEQLNANGEWNLPVPATFIIDTDGVIRSRYFNHDFRTRMEPADIIAALKNLPSNTPEPKYEEAMEY